MDEININNGWGGLVGGGGVLAGGGLFGLLVLGKLANLGKWGRCKEGRRMSRVMAKWLERQAICGIQVSGTIGTMFHNIYYMTYT